MSFSGAQAQAFFGPLRGKTATFIVDGRKENAQFARTIMSFLSLGEDSCSILDLDAFYSSNADVIFSGLPAPAQESIRILLPPPGTEIESEFPRLFMARQRIVVVDSLNSLHHLLSQETASARSRELTFAVEVLSYLARTNAEVVLLTMYRREGFARSGRSKSIAALSDVTATAEVRGEEITFRNERGRAWPGGRFSTRIP
jgi:hypothetical protein